MPLTLISACQSCLKAATIHDTVLINARAVEESTMGNSSTLVMYCVTVSSPSARRVGMTCSIVTEGAPISGVGCHRNQPIEDVPNWMTAIALEVSRNLTLKRSPRVGRRRCCPSLLTRLVLCRCVFKSCDQRIYGATNSFQSVLKPRVALERFVATWQMKCIVHLRDNSS